LSYDYFINSSGIILFRKVYGETTVWTKLFLKNYGIITATAPALGKHSFGGDTEPFCWGQFSLKRKQKGKNYHIDDLDLNDDMLDLRQAQDKILTAFRWSGMITKHLPLYQPDNELLANLYWNMKLLCYNVPSNAANWRFIFNWLKIWGLAPDIIKFCQAKNFNRDETILLTQITRMGINNVIKIFSSPISNNIRRNIFKSAAIYAYRYLNQK